MTLTVNLLHRLIPASVFGSVASWLVPLGTSSHVVRLKFLSTELEVDDLPEALAFNHRAKDQVQGVVSCFSSLQNVAVVTVGMVLAVHRYWSCVWQ